MAMIQDAPHILSKFGPKKMLEGPLYHFWLQVLGS